MGHPMHPHQRTVLVRVLGRSVQPDRDHTPDTITIDPDPDDEDGEHYWEPMGDGIESLWLDYDEFMNAIGANDGR